MSCSKIIRTALTAMIMTLLAIGGLPEEVRSQEPDAVLPPSAPSADNPLRLTVDHVTISVADIDKVAAWYVQVLGFKEVGRGNEPDGLVHRELRISGVFRVDLSSRKGSVRHTVGLPSDMEQGWRHLVFKTPSLETALQLLQAKHIDIRVGRNPKDNTIRQLFILDPEGNEIELQH
jgi:catechol 2,3-dioxygenase-like lactoylglutathione lyase family enzyme